MEAEVVTITWEELDHRYLFHGTPRIEEVKRTGRLIPMVKPKREVGPPFDEIEEAFERARRRVRPQAPPRLACVFLTFDIDVARTYTTVTGAMTGAPVVVVKVSEIPCRCWIAHMGFIADAVEAGSLLYEEYGEDYWRTAVPLDHRDPERSLKQLEHNIRQAYGMPDVTPVPEVLCPCAVPVYGVVKASTTEGLRIEVIRKPVKKSVLILPSCTRSYKNESAKPH